MTHHTGEWHWLESERLLEQAETLAAELDMSWPELRARYDILMQRAHSHAELAASAPGYGFHRDAAELVAAKADTLAGNKELNIPIRTEHGAVIRDNSKDPR